MALLNEQSQFGMALAFRSSSQNDMAGVDENRQAFPASCWFGGEDQSVWRVTVVWRGGLAGGLKGYLAPLVACPSLCLTGLPATGARGVKASTARRARRRQAEACATLHGAGFADRAAQFGAGRLLRGLGQPPHLVADAHQKHGLAGILQQIDDPVRRLFQIDGFAVGEQMSFRCALEGVAEALAHVLLQETQHPPDFLEGKSLPPQLGDNGDFQDLLGQVNALMTVLARRNDASLVPPLQLAQADATDTGHVGARVLVAVWQSSRPQFFCFEHFAPLSVWKNSRHSGLYFSRERCQ